MLSTIVIILITLLLSAFFSGAEIAFVSANKLGIEVMRNKGDKRGRILANFYEKPKGFLSTMLVGNNISLVIFTIFMTKLIEPLLAPPFEAESKFLLIVVTLIITLVILIFGEFLPKTLFRLYANEILYKFSYPLSFLKWILMIPASIMTGLSNFLLKSIFRISTDEVENVLTKIDLEHYINDSISEEETFDKEILTNALNLKLVKVRDCMIPRNEIIHIDAKDNLDDLLEAFQEARLSRIIVKDGDIENVIGYIHHQQLLKNPENLKKIIMPITYIPEAMNVQDLMMNFIKEGTSIACVVDEFGGTAGLITLEDILEEIFGEIEDEYDDEDHSEEVISETEYRFAGRLEISQLNERYENINFPDGEYHTLSGYIVMTHQTIPDEGEELDLDGYRFVFEKVSDTKIETVKVIVLPHILEE
ncbi:MAG: putative hemolysin [Saprospiraceae bacterium]|jgi:putative hemolysin|tara:strand:+ start:798 stop:2057 length:1260 start_codon:yes stop_codon:yes gene_type:complete